MDVNLEQESKVSAWQANSFVFLKLLKEKLLLATNRTAVHPPKELTTEALSMIVVVAIFIVFAVLGSISTAFQFFYEESAETRKPSKNTGNKNFTKNLDCTNNMQMNCIKCVSVPKDWLSKARSFLHCFCIVKNGKKIFQTDPGEKKIECFHGIRVISNLTIILAHVLMFDVFSTRSVDKFKPTLQSWIFKLFNNAAFGPDAFFVLSGFVNAYSFSKAYDKNNGKICWWSFYLKRYLRITPVSMMVLGFYTTFLSYTGSGPVWPEYVTNPSCKETWWRYLLHINNFQLAEKSCMPWLWYLAVEMQFYVISPIFLLSLLRWKRFGYTLSTITICCSSLSAFLIIKQNNLVHCQILPLDLHNSDLQTVFDGFIKYFDELYIKPYTRIISYLIGLLLGYYFHGRNFKEMRNRWITLCFGWIAAGILICISFFSLLKRDESVFDTALYNSVKHLFFSVGLSWLIFVCLTEQGSFINAFLSWKLFIPLSKLSYCAYIIHMLIIQKHYQAIQEFEESSILSLVLLFFRVYFWTFVISIPVSLLFEMPMVNLLDLYMKKDEVKKKEKRL